MDDFVSMSNNRRLLTVNNQTPLNIWSQCMLDVCNNDLTAIQPPPLDSDPVEIHLNQYRLGQYRGGQVV